MPGFFLSLSSFFFDSLTKCLGHELSAHELLVAAVHGDELIVRSLLDDVALAHTDDLVCADDCAEPMSDHDNGLLLLRDKSIERLLHRVLTVSVQGTGSLVE